MTFQAVSRFWHVVICVKSYTIIFEVKIVLHQPSSSGNEHCCQKVLARGWETGQNWGISQYVYTSSNNDHMITEHCLHISREPVYALILYLN